MNKCLSDLIKLPNESVVFCEVVAKTFRTQLSFKKKVTHYHLNLKYGLDSVQKTKLDGDYDLVCF